MPLRYSEHMRRQPVSRRGKQGDGKFDKMAEKKQQNAQLKHAAPAFARRWDYGIALSGHNL